MRIAKPLENSEDYTASPEPGGTLELHVPDDASGMRLDQVLARLMPRYSRSRLQGWIEAGLVMLDGAPASVKQKVWGGESIRITPQAHPAEVAAQAEAITLDIVHEDEAILIINKPAGLVVHPGSGNWSGTLLNALLHHAPQLAGVPRAGIVHRLDKDTSGLLVVAKTLEAQTDLVRQLQARSVKRIYLALVEGALHGAGTVEGAIGRHPTQRTKMALTERGKPAVTHYRVLEHFAHHTLVECSLETGRTHQIRVHMQSIGHPLAGDAVYGAKRGQRVFHRQALHAARLGLLHPVTGEFMQWEASLPADMANLLETLRGET